MKQCGKLVTMGHGDHAKCGEDYWGKFFQCDSCKAESVWGKVKRKGEQWRVQVASTDENSSPTTQHSPTPEPEVLKTLQGLDEMLIRLHLKMTSMEDKLDRLVDALAEEQDPDEIPATYMDGSKI